MKKRILSTLLALCMVLTLLPGTAWAAEEPASGTCGENLKWTLEDGVLTVSGLGAMENYSYIGLAPWYNDREFITTIKIEDGVTGIGDFAFFECTGLTSVTLPDSVTNIGISAFEYCNSLTDVYYSGTKSQWDANFMGCIIDPNGSIFTATIHYNSTGPDELDDPVATAISDSGHRYELYETGMTWTDAKTYCENLGGHLVSITSRQEQKLIENLLEQGSKYQYWLGLSYPNGDMTWVTGEPYSYANWDKNQPDHACRADGQRESYIQIYNMANPGVSGSERFGWNDIFADNIRSQDQEEMEYFSLQTIGFICEYEPDTPIPDIHFDQDTYSVKEEETITATVSVPNPNGLTFSNINFNCTSSDSEIASVTSWKGPDIDNGLNPIPVTVGIRGLQAGTAIITASVGDGKSASCRVTIQTPGKPGDPDFGDSDPNGFSSERDGWSLGNIGLSFGYPENYRIPFSRYYDVFGISLSSLFVSGADSILEWGGNCFGLSLLALANYNSQIDLSTCFPGNNGKGLYGYGYDAIEAHNGKQFFAISGNDMAIEAVEKAQISQFSQEFKKAKVFENDSTYSDLLSYLSGDAPKPILVKMLPAHHAVAIDTSVKPIESPNDLGWYYVKLYDSNSPAPSESLNNPAMWYAQKSPCLMLDTNSGRFQYWRYGECVGTYSYKSLIQHNIEFFDVSKLGNDYFTKPLKLFGNLVTIQFASNDIQLLNASDEIMFEVKDGSVTTLADECEYSPYLAGDSDTLIGSVTIPNSEFSYLANAADVIIWSEEDYYAISSSDIYKASVDLDNQFIGVIAEKQAEVTLFAQENGIYGYDAYAIGTTLGSDENVAIELSDSDGVRIVSSGAESLTLNMDDSNTDPITTVVTDANDVKVYKDDGEFLIYSDTDGDGIYETPINTPPASTTYLISFDVNGGTISGPTVLTTGTNGKLSNLPSAYRSGFTFNGWYTNDGIRVTTDTIFDADTTVYAHWSYNSGGSSSSSSSGSFGSGNGSSDPTYSVSVPSRVAGGKVTVRPTSASAGNKVTIIAKPNSSYDVGEVTVTDKDGKEVTVADAGDGKYTFIMPKSKVDVKVEFIRQQTTPADSIFIDIQPGAYYADAVAWAVEKGITVGTSATTFSPNASCTRAQIVTFLWRAAGSPKVNVDIPFIDVQPGAYYYDAVLWAVEQGITSGTSATTFSPDTICTRAQAVTFLYRYEKSPVINGSGSFTDIGADAYYADAVQWAVSKGVTAGTSATFFSPNETCTRAQIVTFLYRGMA